ncbi:hypothetical protein A5886_002228 [Enterococcus sp. 8G7_MSG3316]|uniref:Uncharacterized protein n=1 Tax=Candidatus Enterococcus testudinis TaxID=1834191 RepID=A0A242A7Y4_9ENTE|nr:hypothetical protein [Enterococcus sp. 8G7_MSG3316]OTN77148.1 hypothetical protein A5886_002228 [Enterococcus sp. 8G7_MSG3316]
MKKKQLAKLKQQFRPSYETARQQLFAAIEAKTAANHDLPTTVYINPKNQDELLIELLKETQKEQKIAVPLDENFKIVVKRIQRQEAGLLDRFSDNLVDEIAAYWLQVTPQPAVETKSTPEEDSSDAPAADDAATAEKAMTNESAAPQQSTVAGLSFTDFADKIAAFPKFSVERTDDETTVVEQTPKEQRILATISEGEANQFDITSALERKYKIKLDVIPLIEAYAATALNQR